VPATTTPQSQKQGIQSWQDITPKAIATTPLGELLLKKQKPKAPGQSLLAEDQPNGNSH
jgi:hypothetical protein